MLFRFRIVGAIPDDSGCVEIDGIVKLVDAQQRTAATQEIPRAKVRIGVSGHTRKFGVYSTAGFRLYDKAVPGVYRIVVKIRDRGNDAEASFERQVTIVPLKFAIPRFECYADAECTIATSACVAPTQMLHLQFNVIGFEVRNERAAFQAKVSLLDEGGTQLQDVPTSRNFSSVIEKDSEMGTASFRLPIGFNAPGRYRVRIEVTDKVSLKKASFDAPVHVVSP
jgi:hypothetical protein